MADSVTDTNVDQNNEINIGKVDNQIQIVKETIPDVGQSRLGQSGVGESGLAQSGIASSGVVIPQTKGPFNIKTQVIHDIEAAILKGKQKKELADKNTNTTGTIVPKKTFVEKIIANNEPGSKKLQERRSAYQDPKGPKIKLKGGKKKTKKTKKIKKNKRTTKKTKKSKKNETRRR